VCKEDARGYLAWGVSKKNYLGGVRNHMCGGGGVKKWHKFSKRLDEFSCVLYREFFWT